MPSANEIRERIAGIQETKKVTDALYRIASVKLRRAKRELENTAPYFRALEAEIEELLQHIPETKNRYFRTARPAEGQHKKRGVLLITSDKGLAGDYNRAAIAMTVDYLSRHPAATLFVGGEFGRRYFETPRIPFREDFGYAAELPTLWVARRICADLLEDYDGGELDEIDLIFTDYENGSGRCVRRCLLPLESSLFRTGADTPDQMTQTDGDEKEFYPDPDAVLDGIVPSYLIGYVYSSLVDSYCSEQQARMTAMHTAGENADELLGALRLQYNSLRQAAITREMTEITAGARALRKTQNKQKESGEDRRCP